MSGVQDYTMAVVGFKSGNQYGLGITGPCFVPVWIRNGTETNEEFVACLGSSPVLCEMNERVVIRDHISILRKAGQAGDGTDDTDT